MANKKIKVIEFFDNLAYDSRIFARDCLTRKAKENEHKIVEGMLTETFEGLALDAGCGIGGYFNILFKKGYSVVGVDISLKMLKVCRRKYTEAELVLADLEKMPFKKGVFDVVLCIDTLQYFNLTSRKNVIRQLVKLLKTKGTILLDVKNKWCPAYWIKYRGGLKELYSMSEVLKGLGLRNVKVKPVFPLINLSPLIVVRAESEARNNSVGD